MSIGEDTNARISPSDEKAPTDEKKKITTESSNGSSTGRSEKSHSQKERHYKSLDKTNKTSLAYQRDSTGFTPASQRRSYVEEPESEYSSTSNPKSADKVLVRRVTNELQIAQYEKEKVKQVNGDNTKKDDKPVYKLYAFRFVESGLRRALWYFGRAVPFRKLFFALLPVTFVLLSLIGPIVHHKQISIISPFKTFLSRSSTPYPASGHSILRANHYGYPLFNGSNPAYSAFHRDSPSDFAILLHNMNSDQTVLNDKTIRQFVNITQEIKKVTVNYERMNLTWADLCHESCNDDENVLWQIIESDKKQLTFPETIINPKGNNSVVRVLLGLIFGGIETDADGIIVMARAMSTCFKLKDNFRPEILSEFNKQFTEIILDKQLNIQHATNAILSWWSFDDFNNAVVSGLRNAHLWLISSALVLLTCCVVASFGVNGYQSKPLLGLVIGIILIVSCLAGFFVQLTGVGYVNSIVFPVFYVLIGIGLLVLFTLENTWSKYSNAACDPVEKLSLILSWDAPCTAITSLIIIFSFSVIGSTTNNPYLQYLSFVLAAGIAVLLLFALLFFTVFLYVAGRRETEGVKWYQCFRSGDTHFAPRTINGFNDTSIGLLHEKLTDIKPSLTRALASAMSNSYLRCPIAFTFAIYLVIAFWGCKDIKVDMKEEYFIPKESTSRKYVESYRTLFGKYEEFLELVFDEPIDYLDGHRREEILSIIDWPVQNQFAIRSVSWLKDFIRFESNTIYDINPDTFVPIIGVVFLTTDNYKKYRGDLVFDKFQTRIISSRMYVELSAKGVQEKVMLIDGLLNKARAVGISMIIKAPFTFSLQHDMQVISTIIVAFGLFVCSVCLLSLFLFGIPSLTALLLFSDISVFIGVIGFSTYWSVPINIITLSMALVGNALTTTIVVYFCYNYVIAGKLQKTGESHVRYSFQTCFSATVLACVIPLITYLPLLFLGIPVIMHVFKVLVLTSLITSIHLLLFLPNMMIFLTEQLPSLCSSLQEMCNECCCLCFDMEEDVGSIYYVPTDNRNCNLQYLNGFTRQYSYALTASSTRGMLLPSASNYIPVATSVTPVIVPDVLPCHATPIDKLEDYRPYRNRRSEKTSAQPVSVPSSPKVSRPNRQTPRRERRKITDDHSPNEESIYEEPPSPPLNRATEPRSPRLQRHTIQRVERQQSHPSKYGVQNERTDLESAIEMQSNWKQYFGDGSLRKGNNMFEPPVLYYSTPSYRPQPPHYSRHKKY